MKKLVYLYPSKGKNKTIDEYLESKVAAGKEEAVIQVTGGTVRIGKYKIIKLAKKQQVSKELFDRIENTILTSMLFNVNKENLNSKDPFSFTVLKEDNT